MSLQKLAPIPRLHTTTATKNIINRLATTTTTTTTRSFHATPTSKMRIPYVPDPADPATTSPEDLAVYDRVRARRDPRPLQPLDRALLHSPPVADGWNSFLGAVRTKTSSTSDALRELAVCRVAVCNTAWYEWHHHAPLAEKAGVSAEALRVVVRREGAYGEGAALTEADRKLGLGDKEWAVLKYTDEMTRNVRVRDETFEELKALCGEREVVEITAIIAAYNCVSRFLVALDVGERNAVGPEDSH